MYSYKGFFDGFTIKRLGIVIVFGLVFSVLLTVAVFAHTFKDEDLFEDGSALEDEEEVHELYDAAVYAISSSLIDKRFTQDTAPSTEEIEEIDKNLKVAPFGEAVFGYDDMTGYSVSGTYTYGASVHSYLVFLTFSEDWDTYSAHNVVLGDAP